MGARRIRTDDSLSAGDVARVVRVYSDALNQHRPAINRLNVYPVPDGDTGTNMALTVAAVRKELDEAQANAGERELDMEEIAACLSHGSLMGRRQLGRDPFAVLTGWRTLSGTPVPSPEVRRARACSTLRPFPVRATALMPLSATRLKARYSPLREGSGTGRGGCPSRRGKR